MDDYDDRTSASENDNKALILKKRKFDPISILLLVLGIILLAFGTYFLVEPIIRNNKQDAAAEELLGLIDSDSTLPTITFRSDDLIVNGEVDHEETFYTVGSGTENGDNGETEGSELAGNGNGAPMVTVYGMGSIRIPGINLVMPLANNTDVYSLRVAIGHYPASALPHETGTGVYFGHRMTSDGRYFNKLGQVSIGSDVYIDYQGKRYTYKVDQNYIIPVEDLGSIVFRQNDSSQRILLVTCHPLNSPPGQSPERILVEGYLTDISG
ncbi:MAG TPA: sortase [Oscillospiraceae bacterium]|jgi:LPXTG-site transpeptidase (sortase) family protein|nr:sortase [Oscillospiraceae bacterium]